MKRQADRIHWGGVHRGEMAVWLTNSEERGEGGMHGVIPEKGEVTGMLGGILYV